MCGSDLTTTISNENDTKTSRSQQRKVLFELAVVSGRVLQAKTIARRRPHAGQQKEKIVANVGGPCSSTFDGINT